MIQRLRVLLAGAFLLAAVTLGGAARADSQIGPTTGALTCCATALPIGSYIGQSFKVPAGETRLTSAMLKVGSQTDGVAANFVLEIRTYNGGVLGATALATSGPLSSTINPWTSLDTFTLTPAGGLTVTPLGTYAIIATHTGGVGLYLPMITAQLYADGSAIQNTGGGPYPNSEAFFQVNFTAAPTPVPTLSEWATILLGLILAGGAVLLIHRWASPT